MPMYTYKCHSCDEQFEKRRSFSQSALLPHCPACESADTMKLLARINVNGFATPAKKTGRSIPLTMNRMASSCCGGGACGCQAVRSLSAMKK